VLGPGPNLSGWRHSVGNEREVHWPDDRRVSPEETQLITTKSE
jgi:hypothetical protein